MKKIKAFAVKRPYLFGLLLIVFYSILGTLTYPTNFLFKENRVGETWASALGKLIIFLVFFAVLWGFGFIKKSGFTTLGKGKCWLLVLGLLVYLVVLELFAFTGDLRFSIEYPRLVQATLAETLAGSLVEETMIRALLFSVMLTAWGDTKKGIIKAVVLSSTIFGVVHLFNLIVRPPAVVFLQALIVMLPGILYAVLLLKSKSIYPAIVIHWLTNATVNIKILTMPDYQESIAMWLIFGAGLLPLMVGCWFVLKQLPEPQSVAGE